MSQSTILITMAVGFLITVMCSPIFIPFLKRLKFGQSIREEGPESHQVKSGTPTMGGLMIIFATVIASLALTWFETSLLMTKELAIALIVLVGYGLIGFLDDFIIIAKKRNLGLTSKQKMLAQIVIAVVVYWILHNSDFSTAVTLPGTDLSLEFGWLYSVLILLMLVGTSNAVNLTDGLDGLVSGTASIAFAAFGIIGWAYGLPSEIVIFTFAMVGALLGFLVFNSHPAKVFMGDTGSLAVGASLAIIAILMKLELLLILIGGVFVVETLSVMLQVIVFKATGQRVLKMSPLHHHYELSGWSEWRVVATFWTVGFICAALGVYIEVFI
ncbi:phospho-N-acetylmuramoyl-pentapeptide-transferase [Alkalibacillus salilacus]|uniref:Phospho-N-acetylmuramoyl-pentapeptide-transferase n=2 Tax=Alkalibacillus salilacus TaxID=284582 RepID=A0ABT9VE49_9BACI|nr:phospho-N-acetylmuramoyl-pentapeptide-transferase [Alkalibacillus salilacus]MDQ0159182.1 phospho-N-acetylmuramoyl-pentapeptide-transferase [Alkalibacillus salilacus]